ncbi:MAG: polymerase, sigma 28 subunit, FliA/WhiG [Deltaproteobacteria bacterium]|jgi:RNA polymerase sigma factor for flagellar operon FliA|nr:polymerase, sigma 28 subunit, FliA/WhiG [Deltaproteobacteria bacterium]
MAATNHRATSRTCSCGNKAPKATGQREPVEREALVLKHAHLIKQIAARLATRLPPTINAEDLVSAGTIGLIEAIKRFDPSKKIQFKTYARFRIRGAMLDQLRLLDWVPRSVRKKESLLKEALDRVESAKGWPADDEEVSAELGMDLESYHLLLQEVRGMALIGEYELARFLPELSCDSVADLCHGDEGEDPFQCAGFAELRDFIAEAIARLPDKERLVVTLYYYEELTMREIAEIMNYTESRVSQLHTRAILRMRRRLRRYFPELASTCSHG